MALYLSMDGVDDKLSSPSFAFDEVIYELRTKETRNWKTYFEAPTGTSRTLVRNGSGGTNFAGWTTVYANGIVVSTGGTWLTQNEKVTMRMLSTSITSVAHIGSNQLNTAASTIDIFSVKFYNTGVLQAHYDMTTGTVQDQSGNGRHATLTGGTWLDDGTGGTGTDGSINLSLVQNVYNDSSVPLGLSQSVYNDGVVNVGLTQTIYSDLSSFLNLQQTVYTESSINLLLNQSAYTDSSIQFSLVQDITDDGLSGSISLGLSQIVYNDSNVQFPLSVKTYTSGSLHLNLIQAVVKRRRVIMTKAGNFLKRNDSDYEIVYFLEDEDGSFVDITGASVRIKVGNSTNLIIDKIATIDDPIKGEVSYVLTEDDTMFAGSYLGEFEVTFPEGARKTYPRSGYLSIIIQKNVDGGASNITLDSIAAKQGDFENKLDQILAGSTNEAEIIDARNGFSTLGNRLGKVDTDVAQVKTDLAEKTTQDIESNGYGVIEGLLLRAQATPNQNMTIQIDDGTVHLPNGKRIYFNPVSSFPIDAADSTQRRKDIIYVNSSGVISVLKGSYTSGDAVAPTTPTGGVLLGVVTINPAVTAIYRTDVQDTRYFKYSNNQISNQIQNLRSSKALSIRPSEGIITKMLNYAQSYVKNVNNFAYGDLDAFDDGAIYTDANGKYQMTCTTFAHLLVKGISYENSKYNGLTQNVVDKNFNDELDVNGLDLVTYNWAKWAYDNGYGFAPDADFKNVMPGDILFFSYSNPASQLTNHNTAFMNLDHTAVFVKLNPDGSIDVYENGFLPAYRTYTLAQRPQVKYCCRMPYNSVDLDIKNIIFDGSTQYTTTGNYLVNTYTLNKTLKQNTWYTGVIKGTLQTANTWFSINCGSTVLYSGKVHGIQENGLYTYHFNTGNLDLSANNIQIRIGADSEEAVPSATRNAVVNWLVVTEGFTKSVKDFIDGGSKKTITFTFTSGFTGSYDVYYGSNFAQLNVRITNPTAVIADSALVTVGTFTGSALNQTKSVPCSVMQQLSASPSYVTDATAWVATDTTPYRLRLKNGTTQNRQFLEISVMLPI